MNDGTLRVAGANLFYRVRGSGPPLLILPGGDGASDSVGALREQLADRYRVVTYDRRGLARSTIEPPAASLTLATHSDDAHRLLAAQTLPRRWRRGLVRRSSSFPAAIRAGSFGRRRLRRSSRRS